MVSSLVESIAMTIAIFITSTHPVGNIATSKKKKGGLGGKCTLTTPSMPHTKKQTNIGIAAPNAKRMNMS